MYPIVQIKWEKLVPVRETGQEMCLFIQWLGQAVPLGFVPPPLGRHFPGFAMQTTELPEPLNRELEDWW